jgi:hypothetical protein
LKTEITQNTTDAGNAFSCYACIPDTSVKRFIYALKIFFSERKKSKPETLRPLVSCIGHLRDFQGEYSNLALISINFSSFRNQHFNLLPYS